MCVFLQKHISCISAPHFRVSRQDTASEVHAKIGLLFADCKEGIHEGRKEETFPVFL